MQSILISELENIYRQQKEQSLFGKWITFSDINPLLSKFNKFTIQQIGSSENNTPIYSIKIGKGVKKIMIWSQMHGNESTGTKAVFDLLNCFANLDNAIFKIITNNCTIQIIPMLNPDGALAYTRVNAHQIDLNRDAVDQKAKESKLLRKVLEDFNPSFCFNLHDQRTIFGVENTKNTATISFLAPSEEPTRKITEGRKQTMDVIVAMNMLLQQAIPNHIGRYTDEFYPTATGDNFQKLGYNTVLIEAGHYPDDYDREQVRKFNFYALLQGIYHIATTQEFTNYKPYFDIPNNQEMFFDVIHRYPQKKAEDIAFQYIESIKDNHFLRTLEKVKEGDLSNYFGHHEIIQ
ncbi:M14 family zinc carboxypeptidase [Tenacibaculum sp. UWU-22]|uniref:M14 family zinc carboxypeptidase n=1 Tax=Tenacibaculum sp. UWU-22 TaxID=3234187 RepID=UPI0034DB5D7B